MMQIITHKKTGKKYMLIGEIKVKVEGRWENYFAYNALDGEYFARREKDLKKSFELTTDF